MSNIAYNTMQGAQPHLSQLQDDLSPLEPDTRRAQVGDLVVVYRLNHRDLAAPTCGYISAVLPVKSNKPVDVHDLIHIFLFDEDQVVYEHTARTTQDHWEYL